jgi:acyl-CoA reductase-like NAD-dependent aldehyde dehydrogenase
MISPFNFPAMVPFWFLPYAIAMGNTYVVKASEQVGIPAPVAYLLFGGMKASQFADIKARGKAIINFFTESRIILKNFGRRTVKTKKLEINSCSWYCVNNKAALVEQLKWLGNTAEDAF